MSERMIGNCPMENYCIENAEDGPVCGSDIEHVWPVLPAEEICVQALSNRLKEAEYLAEQEADNESRSLWRRVQVVGSHLELALSPELNDQEADEHFRLAEERVQETVGDRRYPIKDRLEAVLYDMYIPYLRQRRRDERRTPEESEVLQSSLADVSESVLEAPIHDVAVCADSHDYCVRSEKTRSITLRTLSAHMLAARIGLETYPAFDREQSRIKDNENGESFDHHFSVLMYDIKVPVRLMQSEKQAPPEEVVGFNYYAELDKAALDAEKHVGYSVRKSYTQRHHEWIIDKARGDWVEWHHLLMINAMSQQMLVKVRGYADALLKRQSDGRFR